MVITTHKHMQTETAFNFWAAFHSFFFFFEKLLLILERVHRAHIDVNDKSFAFVCIIEELLFRKQLFFNKYHKLLN